MEAEAPKKRGRPPGARNIPTTMPILTPPADRVKGDYKHADPETIISRQLSMLDWAQQALRNEMMSGFQAKGTHIDTKDIERLEKLSNAIVRAVDALKKSSDLSEELAKRLTAEQLLEAAIAKVEAQDIKTLKYAIKRLRAYLETLGPVRFQDRQEIGEVTATGAIAALEDEP